MTLTLVMRGALSTGNTPAGFVSPVERPNAPLASKVFISEMPMWSYTMPKPPRITV